MLLIKFDFFFNIEDNPTQNEAVHSNILFIVLLPCCYAFNANYYKGFLFFYI